MPSGKPTALHFSLIIFVMLALIFGVALYFTFDHSNKITVELKKSKGLLATEKGLVTTRDNQISWLKTRIGHKDVADVGTLTDAETDSVLGMMRDDISRNADAVDALGRSEILLRDTISKNSKKYLDSLDLHYKDVAAKHDKDREDAETQLAVVTRDSEAKLTTAAEKNDELRGENTNLLNEKQQVVDNFGAYRKDSESKKQRLEGVNNYLNDELRRRERPSYDRADGLVRWVDHISGLVWINLGRDDKLTTRTHFSVYHKTHHGVGRDTPPKQAGPADKLEGGPQDIVGSIEVTRVISAHLSEARILDRDNHRPIQPGDPIYTPLWDPGRPHHFALIGLVDLDGDHNYRPEERDELFQLIGGIGGAVVHEVGRDGRRLYYTNFPHDAVEYNPDEHPGIDLGIKFVVVGDMLKMSEAATQDVKSIADEARHSAVRRVNLSDFLSFIGYVPQRRLFVPGLVDRPYDLKSGAASRGVGETVGERKATGKVSSIYTRSKRLKRQPKSTGKTTGRYQDDTQRRGN